MTSIRSIFVCVILGSTTATTAFAKTLRLTTFSIPLMVESDKKGIFIDLTLEIVKRNNIKVDIDVIPTGKSLLEFSSGRADGFFPGLDVYMPRKISRTLAFYDKADFVFYKKGKVLSNISDLEGKKVGLTFRYPYAKKLMDNKKIRFEFAEDDIASMRKLGRGLIDAFIVEERSGLKALEMSGVRDVEYQAGKPLSVQEVYYAFQDTDEGRKYADMFSKTLTKMKNDGLFEKIMFSRQPVPSP